MTDDLIAFFEARLDDDERVARAKRPTWDDDEPADAEDLWNAQVHTSDCGYRMGAFNDDCICEAPSFTLAEVDAKRRILDALEPEAAGNSLDARFHAHLIRLLALPLADRPGYLEEWRPA